MHEKADSKLAGLMSKNEMSGPIFKIKNDPRIYFFGRFLRKFSIDELPQLLNVFFGQMSLVGPRPPIFREVKQYEPWQRRRLSMRPGITCIWQVSGRNKLTFSEWMKLDLEYTVFIDAPFALSFSRLEHEPGTLSMSPNVAIVTSLRAPNHIALSRKLLGVTHTGHPGPEMSFILPGRISLRP